MRVRQGASPGRTPHLSAYGATAALLLVSASAAALAILAGAGSTARAAALDGSTPTANPLLVPTAPAASGGGLTSTAIAVNPNGFAPVITLSCVTTIVGLILAIVALLWLRRRGYAPFLRTLLPARLQGVFKGAREPAPQRQASAGGRARGRSDSQDWDVPPARHQPRRSSRRRNSRS